jgi:predicted nucleic acid-binding protein
VIIVDTNVVAYLLIEGENTPHAEAARSRDADWRVPSLFVHEWLNVVTAHVRGNLFDRDHAVRTYRRGLSLVTVDVAMPDPLRILNLHMRSGCSSYDCQFIAIAEDLNVKLVTADHELLRAFPDLTEDLRQQA